MRRWTRDLVAIDSVTGREGELALYLQAELPHRGWNVRPLSVDADNGRVNLLCSFEEDDPRLLFNTHLDTVPDAYGPNEDTDRIYGRGTCDTKGILASMLEAIEDARDDGVQGLGLLLVVGEERDHVGAIHAGKHLTEPEVLIVGEPTENKFMLAQKGLLTAEISASGVEGHSGYPEKYDSAVDRLLPALELLRTAPWLAQSSDDGTTLNLSMLTGGNAFNKVPGTASASLMYRLDEPAQNIVSRVNEMLEPLLAESALNLDWHHDAACDPYFGMDHLPDHPCGMAAFGTDLPFFCWQPQRKYLVGPGSIHQAHRDVIGGDIQGGEWIAKSAQEDGARLYLELIHKTATWHRS
jgi:acetylornithine deacetylase